MVGSLFTLQRLSKDFLLIYQNLGTNLKKCPVLLPVHIYAIMNNMCTPGYHHNGFVATYALGHMMYIYG